MNSRRCSSILARVPTAILGNFVTKMIRQRHLIWNFVIRDLKKRYVGSLMGLFWSVIHPLVLLVSYTFVFSAIFEIRPRSTGTDSFAVFLFCAILPWLYFQETVMRSCTSVIDHSNLIRRTLFPSEVLPVSIAFSNLATHVVGIVILLAVLVYLKALGWAALMVLIYLFLLVIFSLGLAWLVAALQVFLRDTAQILSVVMTFWFWVTPIFYRLEDVPSPFRPWIQLNPLGHVVQGYRLLLLENQLPEIRSTLTLLVFAAAVFLCGGLFFRYTKREFVDVL